MSRRAGPKEVEVVIDQLAADGLGVAELHGHRLEVRNALPAETVTARILKRRKGVRYADAVAIQHASTLRRQPACRYFPRCGGCNMHHIDYPQQLHIKQQQLAAALQEYGVEVDEWAPAKWQSRLAYRRKARLGVRQVGDQVLVGFRESFSNRVAKIDHCEVLTARLSNLLAPLKALLNNISIPAQIPQIELSQGDSDVAIFVRHLAPLTESDRQLWRVFQRNFNVQVLLQSGGYETLRQLDGGPPDLLGYSLPRHGLHMQFHPSQFTQVNHSINQLLISDVLSCLGDLSGARVADLFCGIGNFSLPLVRAGADVIGIEAAADAVQRAQQNAHRNQLTDGVQFLAADLYGDGFLLPGEFDVLLLDPPRSGAGPNLPTWLHSFSGDRVVYVSCNPASFAADAAILAQRGFALKRVGIYDMFPHTAHVETLGYFASA